MQKNSNRRDKEFKQTDIQTENVFRLRIFGMIL